MSLLRGMDRQMMIAGVIALLSFGSAMESCQQYRAATLLTKMGVQETGVVVGRELRGYRPVTYFLEVLLPPESVQPNMRAFIEVDHNQYKRNLDGSTVRVLVDPRPGKSAMLLADYPRARDVPLYSTIYLGLLCAICTTLLVVRRRTGSFPFLRAS